MKKNEETPRTCAKKATKRPYRRPEVHSEEVTEPRGLQETCQPVPDAEQGCIPNA